ncbi:MAG: MEDS domain-containing protein, partial [Thermoplasmata archaeon]|nr:MEDS domain-containing protein [Thermoplasmata archaeon]
MMNASPSYTVNELESCMHICCFYETEEEHQNLLTTFIKKGVERGEKILSIVDAHTLKRFQEFLLDNATKVKTYIDTGQLNLVTIDETYTRNGLFDAEKIIGLLRNETEFAIAGGYTGLRVIKEMGGALKRMKNFDRLIEYETKLNTFFPNSNCFIICQYNRNSIDSKLLLDVLASHPLVMIDNEIYDNFSYLTPTKVLEQDRSTINLYNNRLENLTVRKRAEEASQITSKQMEITFNANNNGICSADKCKKILRYNEAIPNHLNKSEDGLVGRTCFVHLLSTSESIDGYPIVHKRETHQREVLNFNFNERLLNVLFNPIFNNNGNINSKVHSISDSTDHKRTEEKEKQD